ncbi:hypothetical protein SAY86_010446 [Trapa natans]|uniref:BIRD-IDD transcription factor fourth C2HC zinc finger domain-containing protein n=1 Tax=Trapa natans TaxID=22666 RepID=A0AAN7LEN4_TRANT|nr:hypothetical protein SAY86_010446 [Trapa natans]
MMSKSFWKDSFITHRAFCDALAEECTKNPNLVQASEENTNQAKKTFAEEASPPPPPLTPSTTVVSPVLSIQSSDLPENATEVLPPAPTVAPQLPVPSVAPQPPAPAVAAHPTVTVTAAVATTSGSSCGGFSRLYTASTQMMPPPLLPHISPSSLSNMVCPAVPPDHSSSLPSPTTAEPTSLSLFLSSTASSIFSRPEQNHRFYAPSSQPAMSATALLQKAAQMGATSSNSSSLLRGLGLAMSLTSYTNDTISTTSAAGQWGNHTKAENDGYSNQGGLGLGLPSQESSSASGFIMDQSSLFGSQPVTLDFLGLGMSDSHTTTSGISALITSLEGGFSAATPSSLGDMASMQGSGRGPWDSQSARRTSFFR